MIFKPRQVPPSNVKFWFVEALALSQRRLFHFLALSLALYIVISIRSGDVAMFLPPILFPVILAFGCAIAKSADESVPLLKVVSGVGSAGWLRVASAAAIPWAVFVVMYMFAGVFSDGSSGDINMPAQDELRQAVGISDWQTLARFCVFGIVVLAGLYIFFRFTCLVWFLWTLCAVANLPLLEAFFQSCEGVSINRFVMWPYMVSTCLLFVLPMLLGIWVLYPWLAITCSMLYTSYRDVWLSRRTNYPVQSSSVSMEQSVS
ncbi:hypothetical protein N9383_02960 [Granulosicoccus sp.]|nr:hypothetical protein [Granulosicoccus sp.]